MRLGLLGGTFDPVHYGHLILAEQCREQIALEQVWFLPACRPPHKATRSITPGRQRVEMLELAIAGNESFEVCTRELERGGTSYTFETLEQLREEFPERELFFLIGSDSLVDLPTWREPRRIAELATLVVVTRPGSPLPEPDALATVLGAESLAKLKEHVVEAPAIGISSSDLRARVAAGRTIRYQLPSAVECYIETHELYREA